MGIPAGVWLGTEHPDPGEMLAIAADVGYSETAFLVPDGTGRAGAYRVRYFSPAAEVPFCGHATIAAGVALAERDGPGRLTLTTNGGDVSVDVIARADGAFRATLTSVEPRVWDAEATLVSDALAAFGWGSDVLDPSLPPAVAFAGAYHLVLAVAEYETLGRMAYDFDRLKAVMLEADLTTVQAVWREAPDRFRARNPFPVGNVVEDPATGAAAAALGAYLRWLRVLEPPARFTIRQGVEMGRSSEIDVEVPDATGGIRVSGTAVALGGNG